MRVLRAIPFIGLIVLAGCGKFFVPKTSGGGGCTTNCAATDFLYVANQNNTTPSLAGFTYATGSLAAVTTTPYTLSTVPSAIVVNPANTFLYVGGLTNGSIFEYAINTNGTLTVQNQGTAVASIVGSIASMKIDSTGGYLIVASATAPSIAVFSLNSSTGAPTATTGSPYTLTQAGTGTGTGLQALSHLLITPNNAVVYVSEGTAGVGILTFNATTGALTEQAHLNAAAANNSDQGLASDPSTKFLFVTETGGNGLRVLTIGTNGALSEITGSPFQTGLGPSSVLVDTSGSYLYVTNRTDGTVTGFSIATTGALTALNGSPFAVGTGSVTNLLAAHPVDIVEDNSKTYIAVVNSGVVDSTDTTVGNTDLKVFKFSSTTPGALVASASASTGTDPTVAIAIAATH